MVPSMAVKNGDLESLTDGIRRAIESCGKSRYVLSKEVGIDQATLSRFMHRKGGITTENLDRLARHLGITVSDKPKG